MWKKASFASILLFWGTMNTLLWRSEMGAGTNLASAVPVSTVWEKILTAPDDSALSINLDRRKVGFVRWRPNVGEETATGKIASENEPEGIVRKLTEYSVDIEGSVVIDALHRSVRFGGDLRFDPSLKWKQFHTQLSLRPAIWRVKGNAASRELWLESEEDGVEFIRRLSFDDLKNPQKLLSSVESPLAGMILGQQAGALQSTNLSAGLNWTARYEWLRIGQNRVRIYRLNARLLDRHEINILVSRVGEILRVELPLNVKLINDTLFER
jgi:hypothetical protein